MRLSSRGSILILTSGFALAFSMLGIASVHLAQVNNEVAGNNILSSQAFWLAEAGIERARNNLSHSQLNVTNASLGNGTYNISTASACVGCSNSWIITAQGTVDNKTRSIQTTISRFNISSPLTINGELDYTCGDASVTIDCSLIKENTAFTFEGIFNGLSLSTVKNMATIINLTKNRDRGSRRESPSNLNLSGVSWLDVANKSISINGLNGSGIFIIDASNVNAQNEKADLSFQGNSDFDGIIWIIGNVKISGTPNFTGSIFVDGSLEVSTSINGNSSITYDPQIIDQAASTLGSALTSRQPKVVSWKEL